MRSVNFNVFYDLLFRAACWRILHPKAEPSWSPAYGRDFFRAPRVIVVAKVYRLLAELPERRFVE